MLAPTVNAVGRITSSFEAHYVNQTVTPDLKR
jgi:hypothetical protein